MFEQSIRVRESMRGKHTVSAAQADMYNTIRNMGIAAQVEQHIQGISVDIVLPDHSIAIEVDGPSHFFRNDSMLQIGHGAFKKVLLDRMGWTLVIISLQTWDDADVMLAHCQIGATRPSVPQTVLRPCTTCTWRDWSRQIATYAVTDTHNDALSSVLEGIGVRGSQSERVLSQVQELGGSSGVDLENAEAILLLMVDTMDIKVINIKGIVIEYPSILLQSPETLKAKYDTLLSAWPSKRQLAGSIASYPMIFDDDFPEKLRKFMDAMMDIGFDKDDVAKMLTKEPGLVVIRKFELLNILKRFRVDVRDPTELKPILKFFGKNPSVLFPMNFKRVYERVEKLENEGGMPFETAVSVVLQNSKVLDRCDQDFNSIRDIISHIQGYGIDHADVMRMLTRYPAIVTMDAERVQSTLSLLSTFNIPSKDIAQYPRVFSHDPFKVIGPRLSYLSEYCVDKIGKLRLSTILTAGDASFIAKYVTCMQGFEKAKEQNTLQSDVSTVHQKKTSHGEKAEQERASMPRSTPPKPPQNQKKPRKKFWRRKLQRLPKQDGDSSSR
ncbi:RAP domain-containing protein [Picochlorum sp. SENEW3]|nr:RAP domain-containing protein [Picochlorum sp. SENEW3]